ncbi:MAG: DNA adenine methylase [Anaerolineales bacterium]|nr:DNA adenine methylase [Anaerolineales bacterium]
MPNIPQPIPYQGSKRAIADKILEFVPPQLDRIVEPFAGSAALSIAAAQCGLVRRFLLNDLNSPLMGLMDRSSTIRPKSATAIRRFGTHKLDGKNNTIRKCGTSLIVHRSWAVALSLSALCESSSSLQCRRCF